MPDVWKYSIRYHLDWLSNARIVRYSITMVKCVDSVVLYHLRDFQLVQMLGVKVTHPSLARSCNQCRGVMDIESRYHGHRSLSRLFQVPGWDTVSPHIVICSQVKQNIEGMSHEWDRRGCRESNFETGLTPTIEKAPTELGKVVGAHSQAFL